MYIFTIFSVLTDAPLGVQSLGEFCYHISDFFLEHLMFLYLSREWQFERHRLVVIPQK